MPPARAPRRYRPRSGTLGEQIADLSKEVTALTQEAARSSTLRQDVTRLDNMATELAARMRRLDEIRPGVEQAVEQLAALKGTRELLADGLEQMRSAADEMSRLRETHGETQAWLANADVWTRKVQAQVKELSGLEPMVERIRVEVEHGQGLDGADPVSAGDGGRASSGTWPRSGRSAPSSRIAPRGSRPGWRPRNPASPS